MSRAGAQPTYALGAVVRLTGLSDHTLRAWERRYAAVTPLRTSGGTRRYTESDVARLRLLRRGVEAGHPIRELAPLDDAEIERRLESFATLPGPDLDGILAALERLDGVEIERALGVRLVALGVREFTRSLAVPLLHEVGERWARGKLSVAAEHALSAALRGLLGTALRLGATRPADVTVLFTTPSGEQHELGTLLAALFAQDCGARAVYLGPELPAQEIVDAAVEAGAQAVALGIMRRALRPLLTELRALRRALPASIALWVGGAATRGLDPVPGVRVIEDLTDLEIQVDLLRARGAAPS